MFVLHCEGKSTLKFVKLAEMTQRDLKQHSPKVNVHETQIKSTFQIKFGSFLNFLRAAELS